MALKPIYSAQHAVGVASAGDTGVPATVLVDNNGTIIVPRGFATAAVAASKSTVTVVKASAGRLCRVLVTVAGTATTVSVYDNASAASGTVIGIFPGNSAAGTVYDFEMPAANGVTVGGAATNPAMTISFY